MKDEPRRAETGCFFRWCKQNDRVFPRKAWLTDGVVVGGSSPFIAEYALTEKQTKLSLDELADIFPRPGGRMIMADAKELPRYQSHKQVCALKIAGMTALREDTLELRFDDGYASIVIPAVMVARHFPVIGDYYVIYDDGYASLSPAKAFENGYTRLTK